MNTTTPSRHLPSRTHSLAPSPLSDSLSGPLFPLGLARPLSGSSRGLRYGGLSGPLGNNARVLLVLGATGGVDVSAVQIGKVCGAVVIVVVARGDEKVRFLKMLGVDHVVDASQENIIQSVKEFLKRRKLKGIDVLYDPVGGKLTKDSLKLLNILGCKYLGNRVC